MSATVIHHSSMRFRFPEVAILARIVVQRLPKVFLLAAVIALVIAYYSRRKCNEIVVLILMYKLFFYFRRQWYLA